MSSNYTIAFAGMPALLDEQEHVMENFTFERYPDSFKRYCNKHKATLKAVEDGYLQVIDKEQFLTNMAEELANSAEKRRNRLCSCKRLFQIWKRLSGSWILY